jgi:hypothetical protein
VDAGDECHWVTLTNYFSFCLDGYTMAYVIAPVPASSLWLFGC